MANAMEAHRKELLELFTCFCGTSSTLTLAGWLAFADAFDICPGYLSADRLEEVHEAAAGHMGKGQVHRSASRPHGNGLTFSEYQEALCLLATAIEEKRWKVEYAAEKAARYRYKLKDAEKGRVKPGTDEEVEGLLIALDVHNIARMRKRAGIPQGPMPSSGHADSIFDIDAPSAHQQTPLLTDSSRLAGSIIDMTGSVRRTASGVPPAVGAGRNSRRNTGKRAQTPTTPSNSGRSAAAHGSNGASTPLSSPRPPASTPNSGQSHGNRPNSSPATSSESSRRPGRRMRIAADQSFAQLASGRTPEPPTTPRTEHRPTPPSSPRAVPGQPGQPAPASGRSSSPRAPAAPHGAVAARNKENPPRGTSTGGSANVSRTTQGDLCETNQAGSCQYYALSSRGRDPQPLSDIDFVHALLTGSAPGQRKNKASSSTARSLQREGTAASAAGPVGAAQAVAKSRTVSLGRQGRSVQAAW